MRCTMLESIPTWRDLGEREREREREIYLLGGILHWKLNKFIPISQLTPFCAAHKKGRGWCKQDMFSQASHQL